jgi:Undecaprenyl-phosphate glucose phosphotransferase
MLRKYYSVFGPALRATDSTILVLSWLVAYVLRRDYPLAIMTNAVPEFHQYWPYSILIVLLWGATFSFFGLYDSNRLSRRSSELYRVLRAHSTALLVFVALTYLVTAYKLSRGVFVYFGAIAGISLALARVGLRTYIRNSRKKGHNLQTVLFVGTGQSASQAIRKLGEHPELGLKPIGVVGKSGAGTLFEGLPVLGDASELEQILQTHSVHKVIIALTRSEAVLLESVLNKIKDEMVDVILIPEIYDYIALGCEVESFDGLPLVNLNGSPLLGWQVLAKRVFDAAVALITLIILSPLLLLLAALVKLTSPGPVLYGQERMGLDGRTFRMLKFRSMRVDAETKSGPVWATAEDNRKTVLGAFLRKTSLDELPQFWNVLRGDMSLVGPRPERPVFVQKFRNEIPHYMLRHKVKAGITGWAQVNGWRGDTSLEKRIEFDLYYIKNWSMFFDAKILLLTLIKGFVNRNAY